MSITENEQPLISCFLLEKDYCNTLDSLKQEIEQGTAGIVFFMPYPKELDKVTPNVKDFSKDGRFYVFEKLCHSLGLEIKLIKGKKVTGKELFFLHQEMAVYVEKDKDKYPKMRDVYLKTFSGLWSIVVVSYKDKGSNNFPLQERLASLKGNWFPMANNGLEAEWSSNLSVVYLRYLFGDRSEDRENDKHTPVKVRYSGIHIPTSSKDAIEIIKRWETI